MSDSDRYTIPGSGGVLRNKLGHTTHAGVDRAMNRAATTEWAIIRTEPIPDHLDLDYLCSIHRRLLSPVLEWAGELRVGPGEVFPGGTPFLYAPVAFYRQGLDDLFCQLAQGTPLTG